MREITLSQGKVAFVDEANYERISQHKWHYNASTGYAARKDWKHKRYVLMHREIMGETNGAQVDHIDADKLNNCRSNLRLVTSSQNSRRQLPKRETASAFKGLSWYEGRWYVRIFVDGTNVYLGRFADERTAARIYDYAATEHYGEFARLNLPDEPMSGEDFERLTQKHKPSSAYRGVAWDKRKGKWLASISVGGKVKHIGRYSDEERAAHEYNKAANQYHGNRAVLNPLGESK